MERVRVQSVWKVKVYTLLDGISRPLVRSTSNTGCPAEYSLPEYVYVFAKKTVGAGILVLKNLSKNVSA